MLKQMLINVLEGERGIVRYNGIEAKRINSELYGVKHNGQITFFYTALGAVYFILDSA